MVEHTETSDVSEKVIRRRLRGKPLVSRAGWMARQAAYVLACTVAAVAALFLLEGVWLAIGLTVVAFFAGGIFEVLIDFRYSNYRKEWELANGPDLNEERSSEASQSL